MGDNEIFQNLEQRRARIAQVQENSARPGRVLSTYDATGLGTINEPSCFVFSSAFEQKPHFTFGSELMGDYPTMPVCVASVYKWRQMANGFYTGAYCSFYIGGLDSTSSTFDVQFHLTWEGILVKNFISSLGFPVQSLDI